MQSRGSSPAGRWRRIGAAWLIMLAIVAAPSAALAASRLSLVIGNDAYVKVPKLKNPVADSRLIAGKLQSIGFQVDLATDTTKASLTTALRDFGRKIAAAGPDATVIVYYAGHGIQDDKQTNYLIPVDADLQVQADLATEAVSLDALMRMVEQSNVKTGIVVLDACRDNPLPNKTRSAKRGLAVEDRPGLLIAFSTQPGNVALDGDGANSPYAEALAAEITTRGVEVEKVFKNVRRRVVEATGNKQFPWESTRLTQDIYLAGAPTAVQGGGATASQTPTPTADPDVEYAKAVQEDTAAAYEQLLQRFPNHPRRALVVSLLQRKAEEGLWRQAEAARGKPGEAAILERLLTAYGEGAYAKRARDRRAALDQETTAKSAPPTNPRTPPPTPSYHYVSGLDPDGDNWLALRSEPSGKSGYRITTLGPNTPLIVQGTQGQWLRVQLKTGESGWVFSKYVACCR